MTISIATPQGIREATPEEAAGWPGLDRLKAARQREVEQERDARTLPGRLEANLTAGAVAAGTVAADPGDLVIPVAWDSEAAWLRILTLFAHADRLDTEGVTAAVIDFRDADETALTLAPLQMIALGKLILSYGNAVNNAAGAHKDAIAALSTAAEVHAYDISTGWP